LLAGPGNLVVSIKILSYKYERKKGEGDENLS